jgi:hypothetical protein
MWIQLSFNLKHIGTHALLSVWTHSLLSIRTHILLSVWTRLSFRCAVRSHVLLSVWTPSFLSTRRHPLLSIRTYPLLSVRTQPLLSMKTYPSCQGDTSFLVKVNRSPLANETYPAVSILDQGSIYWKIPLPLWGGGNQPQCHLGGNIWILDEKRWQMLNKNEETRKKKKKTEHGK